MGKTKIFLRDGVLEELKAAVKEFYSLKAARIQAIVRGNKEKANYAKAKLRLLSLQKFARMAGHRREFKEKQRKVAMMQRMVRCNAVSRRDD